MDSVFKLLINFNNRIIDTIGENKLSEEDIDIAVKKGYKYISGQSPVFLIKYKKILNQAIANKQIKELELKYLLDNNYFKTVDELYYFYFEDGFNTTPKIPIEEESFKDITLDFIKTHMENSNSYNLFFFINREELIYDYLDLHPSKINEIHYDFQNYSKLYQIIKKHNINYEKINSITINKPILLQEWIKDNPRVLLNKNINYSDINDFLINFTKDCIKSRIFTIEEVLTSPIGYKTSILENALEEDFSRIKLLSEDNNYSEKILDIFIEKLPDTIEYLNKISELFPSISINKIKVIKERIQSLGLTIGPCQWAVIYEDKELMLKSIEKDPLLLVKSQKTSFRIDRLTKEEENKIIEIIRKNNIVFNSFTSIMECYPKIKEEALRINPYIIDSSNTNTARVNNLDNILIEQDYEISSATPLIVFQDNKYILKQLKNDVSIVNNPYFNLLNAYNSEQDVIDVYNIITSSKIKLTPDLVYKLYNPLIYIDALKNNIISLDELYYNFNYIKYPKQLIIYIQNNYSKEEIENANLYYQLSNNYIKNNKLDDEILFKLEKDFSSCKNISNVSLTDESLKKIADIYLLNREDNYIYFNSCDFIKNNPYIVLYENMYYETPIKNIKSIEKYKEKEKIYKTFINELRNGKVKSLNKNNAELLFSYKYIQDIKDIFEQNPQVLDYYSGNNDELENIIVDLYQKGKYIPGENVSTTVCGILLNDLIDNPNSIEVEQEYIERGFFAKKEKYWPNNDKNEDSDIMMNLFLKALRTGKYKLNHIINRTISQYVNKLTKEQLKEIILKYPENIIGIQYSLNPIIKEVLEDTEIKKILENIDQIKKENQEKKHSKILIKIKENPKDTIFLKNSNNSYYIDELDDREFLNYHHILVEQVKNKEIDINTVYTPLLLYSSHEGILDLSILDYLTNNEPVYFRNIPVEYFVNGNNNSILLKYKDKFTHNTIIEVLKNIQKISTPEIEYFINDITDEEAYEILINNKYLKEEVIDYLFSKKTIDIKNLINEDNIPKQLVIKVLKQNINNYQYIPQYYYPKDIDDVIYAIFKNSGMKNPYIHLMFSENFMIKMEFGNTKSPITEALLYQYWWYGDEKKLLEITGLDSMNTIIIKAYMINPSYLKYFKNSDLKQEVIDYLTSQDLKFSPELSKFALYNEQILNKLLENDFQNTIDGLGKSLYNVLDNEKIVDLCLKNKYILTEKSPEKMKSNKEIVINSINNNYQSVKYCDRYMEFNDEEKKIIKQLFIKNNIHYYENIFPFLLNDKDYLIREINNNPYIINDIPPSYFDLSTTTILFKLIKEKIKNKTYQFSINTPKWILEDRQLLLIAYQECPELLDKYNDLSLTFKEIETLSKKGVKLKDNPIEYLNDIINNFERVDDYYLDIDKVYPQELLDKLIDLLIESNYKVTSKTSPVLMNKKMIYYALKNEYDIDESYIKKFINFENLYNTKDKELFKKYISMGYGISFKPFIDIWGLEKSLDLISQFGSFISKVDITIEPDSKLITKKLLETFIDDKNIMNVLIRGEYELTDEEIINGIRTKDNTLTISDNDNLFLHLLRKNSNRIKLYTGNNKNIFIEAEKYGYTYTTDDYIENESFRKSDYITSKLLKKDNKIIEYYEGDNELILIEAINNGFIVTKEKINKIPLFRTSPTMIREAMKKDIDSIYLFQGTNAYAFKDIFELTDTSGRKIIPEPDVVEKLSFIHNDIELMTNAIKYDINNIRYYEGPISKEMEEEIMDLIDSKEKKLDLSYESLKKLSKLHNCSIIFKKAIEYDPKNIALYKNNEEYEELTLLAISKGYNPEMDNFEENEKLCSNDILFKDILKKKNNDLLVYYYGSNPEIIKSIFKELLGEKYNSVIFDEDTLKKYMMAWESFNGKDMHTRLLSYINKDCVEAFQTIDIDYYFVLKYGINNEKMDELVKIINQGKIKDYCKFYQLIKNNYIHFEKNAFGVDIFLKIAHLYNHYPELSKELMEKNLDSKTIPQFISLINENKQVVEIKSVDDLKQLSKKRIENIKSSMNNCKTAEEIKSLILEYVFNMNYEEFTSILTRYINFDTLDKILEKKPQESNEELYYEATNLKILLQMLEETVNATDNYDDLKQLLNLFLENEEEVNKVRSLYYNLKERIRNIYELDAITTLTDINKAKELYLRPKKDSNDPDVIELNDQEYVIYAHVVSNTNLEEFANIRFNGRVTICVSPISNIGKRVYGKDGIVLGYTKIPRGGFIGSSNQNMNSNSYINSNDYEPHKDHYYHLEIKESSSKTIKGHAETLLYRDGLFPTCIIIRGMEPSQQEIDAQNIFKNLGLELPFVHTQEIGDVAKLSDNKEEVQIIESDNQKDTILNEEKIDIGTYSPDLKELHEMRKKLEILKNKVDSMKIEQDNIYDIIKLDIGGSHDMYKCHIKGKRGIYYLKPGVRKGGEAIDPYRSEAMKAAYIIQTVANPDNAVFADVVEVPGTKIGLSNDDMIICSVIEAIPDTTSYDGWYKEANSSLSSKEVSSFIQECIADYLLFSYDTKGENFLRDKSGNTYGIDKEQALKYILSPTFATQDKATGEYTFDTSFRKHNSQEADFNHCGLLYVKLFDEISHGKIDLNIENIKVAIAAIERIEEVDDEEYKKIFKRFIDTFIESTQVISKINFYIEKGLSEEGAKEQVKKDLYDSLLARKHKLREEFTIYFNTILDSYSSSKGVDVSEWKRMLNNQEKMK